MFVSGHKNQKAKFRQRGYYCKACDTFTLIYGNDAAPQQCQDCSTGKEELVLKWDNIVTLDVQVDSTPNPAS